MFVDTWQTSNSNTDTKLNEHEVVFHNEVDETQHLLLHQTKFNPSKKEDTRNKADRPLIPNELWSQLAEDAKLWYLGFSKSEMESYKAKKKRDLD